MTTHRISESERCALGMRNWSEAYRRSPLIAAKLLRVAERIEALFTPLIERHHIQAADFDVLATLRIAEPPYELRPTEIYQTRFCSSGGLTKTLHRLEESKLIERRADPEDKRSLRVRLTAKGKRLVETAMREIYDAEKKLLAEFTHDELDAMRVKLDQLMTILEDENAAL